jgi:hypothetical protein
MFAKHVVIVYATIKMYSLFAGYRILHTFAGEESMLIKRDAPDFGS